MNEDIRVSIEADKGTRNQWAKGLFYRGDGKKLTLVPKNVAKIGSIIFGAVVIMLIFQGSPELAKETKTSPVSTPNQIYNENVDEAPAIVSSATYSSGQQNEKQNEHSEKKAYPRPKLIVRPRPGKIPPGSLVKAVLLTGASNGSVRAEIVESLSIGGETYIEEGSIVLGNGHSGEDRLDIRFTQLVSKDGAVESITAQACDGEDKITGLKGSKIGSQAMKLAMGVGLNFSGGMTEALQDTDGQNGVLVRRPTLRNALLNGAATAALDQSKEVMSDLRNKPPVIEVSTGTTFYILFQGGQ